MVDYKIKALEDGDGFKKGDIVTVVGKKNAEAYVESGCAEYYIDPETKSEESDRTVDWIGAEKFILEYAEKTPGEQEQAKDTAMKKFNLGSKGPLDKILNKEIKRKLDEVRLGAKLQEVEKKKRKLTKREKEKHDKETESKAKDLLVEELRQKSSSDELALGQLVMNYLKLDNIDKASEILVEDFLKKHNVNTLRHDKQDEIWIYYEGIVLPHGKTFIREYLRRVLGEGYVKWFAYRVIEKVSVDTMIDQEEFFQEQHPDFICVQNGILNIRTKELLPFTPKMRFFSKMPMAWNEKAKCPRIIKFFEEILEHKEERNVMKQIFGFLLRRDYFLENAFMFKGNGRNGKSKTLALMKTFLGVESVSEIPLEDLEKDMFSICELHKKSANLCGDLSKTAIKHSGIFKKLTGRDLLTAARKYFTRIKFVNYAKFVFAANELPTTSDLSDAFFIRWIIITFPYQFLNQKEIDSLSDEEKTNVKLQNPDVLLGLTSDEELEGLLAWSIEGLNELLEDKSFSYSPSTKATRDEWLRSSSSFQGFSMDILQPSPLEYVTKEKLRQEYQMYCMENKLIPASDSEIREILVKSFGCSVTFKRINYENVRVWTGISLRRNE